VVPRGFGGADGELGSVVVAFETEVEAAGAVAEGVRLARALELPLRLLCLAPPAPAWALDAGLDEGYRRADVEQHQISSCGHLLERAMDAVPTGLGAEGTLLAGAPATSVVRALEPGSDLVVIASPGVRPVPGVRPGATALELLRRSPCPILLTPTGAREDRERSAGYTRLSPDRAG
jgi:hypothetical protein